jgi:hypothetical protein
LAGLLVGFTPLVQVHSFVALAQWSIAFCLLHFPYSALKAKNWREVWKYIWLWGVFGVVGNLMAFPQFRPFVNRLSAARSQFLQINPIWRTPERRKLRFPWLILWWRGLGVFWAISLLGVAILTKRQLMIYVPSLVVYLITNFIRYQPWELDNTKLFYAAWIPLALPVVANYLFALGEDASWFLIVAVLLGAFSGFSSLIHTLDCMFAVPAIFMAGDFEFGLWVAENTNTKAVFLTSTWHAHPCATIAVRQLFMGYGGWVESHGLDYWGRSAERTRLQHDPLDVSAFMRHRIQYVVSKVVNQEHEFKDFEQIGEGFWKVIFENDEYKVWRRTDNRVWTLP